MLLISHLKRPQSCFSSHFVFWLFQFSWSSCCQYCFWWLQSVFLRAFFYIVFKSLYWCVNTVFNAGKFSFPFFFLIRIVCQCHLKYARLYASFLIFSFSDPFVYVFPSFTLRMVPRMLRKGKAQVFIPFISFLLYSLVSSSFFVL